DPVPRLAAGTAERRAVADPSIDDQEADRAVGSARLVKGFSDGLAVGDVTSNRLAIDHCRNAFERLKPPPKQRDFGARRVEVSRGGRADAGAAASDQRMAPLKPVVFGHMSLFFPAWPMPPEVARRRRNNMGTDS